MQSPWCLCACESPTFEWLNKALCNLVIWYVCHGTWAHLNGVLHKCFPSVFMPVYVSLLSLIGKDSIKCIRFIARQRLGKHIPAATNTRNNRRIVGRVCLCIPLSLLGKKSVKTFPLQRRISGGVVLYKVLVVSREIRQLVPSRSSCCYVYMHVGNVITYVYIVHVLTGWCRCLCISIFGYAFMRFC
jgi:hypothetical protein